MEQISFPFSRNLPLNQLVADALVEIERLGYSRKSRRRYRATWDQLIEFAGRKDFGDAFSGERVARFLEEYRAGGEELGPGEGWRRHVVWGVKVLADFAKHGHIDRARTEVEAIQLVPVMQRTLRDYQQFCKDRLHVRPATLDRRTRQLTIFLDFLHSRKRRMLEEVQALDLDRSSAKGKRDYAILLLACRLGLRAGDIRQLKLDQLHWADSTIEVTQSKTGVPLTLPLTAEVGEALIDYLKSGRPATAHREVFLKVKPPFDPFTANSNLHHIVAYWRRLGGIRFRTPQKRGMQSLRHTLATRLLQKGTPFPTIAEILGHTSLESTRIYAKADVEALRSVALDPEEVNHVA